MNTPQEQPRLPKINIHIFEAINILDNFVARAFLSRQEHNQSVQYVQKIVRHCENIEQENLALKAANQDLTTLIEKLRTELEQSQKELFSTLAKEQNDELSLPKENGR